MTRICAHPDCSNEVTNPKATFCSRKCQGSRTRYAVTAAAPVETSVELDRVHPADDNVRAELTDLDGLADSIREVGILQPLLLQPHPSIDGHYRIIAGHRRHAAARMAGLTHVPFAMFVGNPDDSDDGGRVLAMAVENLQRVDLSAMEEARTLARLRDSGVSQRKIAKAIGKSQPHVSRRLSLLDLPERAQDLVDTGRITLEEAVELSRFTPDELALVLDVDGLDWDHREEVEHHIENSVGRVANRRALAVWESRCGLLNITILDPSVNPGWSYKGLDCRSLRPSTGGAEEAFTAYLAGSPQPECVWFGTDHVFIYLPKRKPVQDPAPAPAPAATVADDEAGVQALEQLLEESAGVDDEEPTEDLAGRHVVDPVADEWVGVDKTRGQVVVEFIDDRLDLDLGEYDELDAWSERHLQQAIVDLYDFIVTYLDSAATPISSYLIDPLVAAAARAALAAHDYPDHEDVPIPTGRRRDPDAPLPWHLAKLDDFRVQAQFNHNPESLKRMRAEVVEHGHPHLEQVLEILDEAVTALEPTLFDVGGAS
jgi:ParB/RepB/Spo0J family partition protein